MIPMFPILFVIFLLCFYYYVTRNHNYWAKRNVVCDPTVPLFGTHADVILGKNSITQSVAQLCKKYPDAKVIGYYVGNAPELIVQDVELIKRIFVTDFGYFHRRGVGRDPKVDYLQQNVFHVDGDGWRFVRQRVSPAFTISKIKSQLPVLLARIDKFLVVVGRYAENGNECNMVKLTAGLSLEVIGATAFGIEMDSLNNEKSLFHEVTSTFFDMSFKRKLYFILKDIFPEFTEWADLNENVKNPIKVLFKKILDQCKENSSYSNPFLDILIELGKQGKLRGESLEEVNPDGSPATVELEMTEENQYAQMMMMFIASYETTTLTTSFALQMLALHPAWQERARREVRDALHHHHGQLTFDALSEMTLLDRIIKETLRLLPVLGVLYRRAAKPYTIPELNLTIEKNVKIIVPVKAIHLSEKYYENPHEFNPDRFLAENSKLRHSCVFLGFGEGGRACLGARMGQVRVRTILASFLNEFGVEPTENTLAIPEMAARTSFTQSPKNGVPLRIVRAK